MNIPLGQPFIPESASMYMLEVLRSGSLSGDNKFTKKCNEWLTLNTNCRRALLTPSCTHALELTALLCNIEPGDEVIMPSFTFSSTANAFALRGARIVFVDIRPDTMNLNEELIEQAITKKTKAIVPVHYAGVSCEMDSILRTAKDYQLYVIEDAAQGLMSSYKGKSLGTLGTFGCLSFHDTKNYTSGEGGSILINEEQHMARAEIIREKGTNRAQFFRGFVDKYSWVDIGSSYLPSDICAALLYAQLEVADEINQQRLSTWQYYFNSLSDLSNKGMIRLPFVPANCKHNAHIFYIRVQSLEQRTQLIQFLRTKNIGAAFHYVPLHSSPAGRKYGHFCGSDIYTTSESEKLVRLPVYANMNDTDRDYVVDNVRYFFNQL